MNKFFWLHLFSKLTWIIFERLDCRYWNC